MTTHLITLVIKQPSDAQARQLMYQELLGLISRYGGEVTSKALEDESSLCELLEQMLPDHEQALSNRIDAAQAFAKQASDAVENLAQTTASAGDLLVLKATVETLDGSVRTLQEKQAKAPPLIVPPPKRGAFPVKPKPKPKPMEPPPFSILGVEYRGGERFLSVAPSGSTQLSQIYLIRQGDAIAGTTWRLTDLDDRTAHFDVAGASRSVRIQP